MTSSPSPTGRPNGRLQAFRGILLGGSGFESQRYLAKWMILGTLIGLVAGLGAVVFARAIDLCTELFLGRIVGYIPPSALGEGGHPVTDMARPWLLPLSLALGGLISGFIVFTFAPEAEGHGTDSAIEALHHKRARIRARIPPIKLVASAITIGSGGSAGREGPTAQISAGFGALLSDWLKLGIADRRVAVAAGMGAGIGAIFRAPLGGAVMAAEILYLHDLEVEALIPSLIASIVGYSVFGLVNGFTPIFGEQAQLGFDHPVQLVYYAILGLLCGAVGILYSRGFYGVTALFHRLRLPRVLKPALGGLILGLIGIFIPQTLHAGYGWVQLAMTQRLLDLPLWIVLILPFARILATALSIGSGGSGGIFGPGMFIGGMLGAAFWRLTYTLLPGMPAQPAPFVIIGMMAMFGGIAHAPLAMMLMVAEMTGNLALLAPAMVAVAVSTALVGDNTIYRSQIPNRASSPYHRVRFSFPLLASLRVQDAVQPPGPTLAADQPISQAEALLAGPDGDGLVVVDGAGCGLGQAMPDLLTRIPSAERDRTPVGRTLGDNPVVLEMGQSLDQALERLVGRGLRWAPVVDHGRLAGRLYVQDVLRVYRAALDQTARPAHALPDRVSVLEIQVSPDSPLAGQTLQTAHFPPGTLVVSVLREGETIFPRADTRLEAGDVVTVLSEPASVPPLRAFVEAH